MALGHHVLNIWKEKGYKIGRNIRKRECVCTRFRARARAHAWVTKREEARFPSLSRRIVIF